MKKISVVTPCYNSEKFIEDCLKSVSISETFGKFTIEHILINDCSTDRTLESIEKYKSSQIKIINNHKNLGSSASRNNAIKATDADYIFCLDHDDVIFQNTLRYLFEVAETLSSPWIYGDFIRSDANLSYIIGQDYYGWNFKSPEDILFSMYTGKHFFQQNSLFARQLFTNIGFYDETILIPQDFDLTTRFLIKKIKPNYLPCSLYIHRFHNSNLTPKNYQNNKSLHQKDVSNLYGKYKKQLKEMLSPTQIYKIEEYVHSTGL